MSNIRTFLRDLSIDPMQLASFVNDPDAVMDAAGLDERAQRILFSGSTAAIWNLVNGIPSDDAAMTPSQAIEGREKGGSLIIVGTGIKTLGQLTSAAICHIKTADVVYYLVADPIAEEVITYLNPEGAVSLLTHYQEGGSRKSSYEAMVQQLLKSVRDGRKTCGAFYGHPGVFAFPSHEAIRRARTEGFSARMIPGISAEDCLFADLGIDPAVNGCQSFEATDFLLHDRVVDTSSQLILWQVGVVGDTTYRKSGYHLNQTFPMLVSRLTSLYGGDHIGIIYEAAVLPGIAPVVRRLPLGCLAPQDVTAASTLYVPPGRISNKNRSVLAAMGVAV